MSPSSESSDVPDPGPGDAFQRYDDGDWDGAIRMARSALKRYQVAGDQIGESHSWIFIGLVHYKAGAMGESSSCMESALAHYARLGDQQGIGRCHRWLARIYERAHNFRQSERHFLLSWTAYAGSGDHAAVAAVSIDIGDMLYLQHDHDQAAKWWARAWNTAEAERLDSLLDAVSERFGMWCQRFFGPP
jgi:hypothetical protein